MFPPGTSFSLPSLSVGPDPGNVPVPGPSALALLVSALAALSFAWMRLRGPR
jgi:hypothetical protein